MARQFRSKRDTRPPTEFVITYEVPATEKVQAPDEVEGSFVEREVPGQFVEESVTFHYGHKVPGELMLRVQAGNDLTNMIASGEQAAAIRELLDLTIVEKEAFQVLLRDPRCILDTELLGDLVNAILEEASERDPRKPGK